LLVTVGLLPIVLIQATVSTSDPCYHVPFRYIVRIEASDRQGVITTEDLEIMVRKQGDTQGQAKCCR
jgi:hypothetical protein